MRKILKNPWAIAIGSTLIVTILASVTTKQSILNSLKWILTTLKNVLLFSIPLYVVIIICGILILLIMLISRHPSSDSNLNRWKEYKKDTYKSWHMKWDYEVYSNTYEIVDLRPVCQCGCDMSFNETFEPVYIKKVFKCPRCGMQYPAISRADIEDFKKIIAYNVEQLQISKSESAT